MALQGEMHGLRNVFTSSKGPGKHLLDVVTRFGINIPSAKDKL